MTELVYAGFVSLTMSRRFRITSGWIGNQGQGIRRTGGKLSIRLGAVQSSAGHLAAMAS